MSRVLGLVANVLAVACVVVALVTHAEIAVTDSNEPSSDPAVVGITTASVVNAVPWLIAAIVLIAVGTGLLLIRRP